MSRVTPPVNKLALAATRSISTSASRAGNASSSSILAGHARVAAAPLSRKLAAVQVAEASKSELSSSTSERSHSTLSAHRPHLPAAHGSGGGGGGRPLMQGFQTSAPKSAAATAFAASAVDFAFLPSIPRPGGAAASWSSSSSSSSSPAAHDSIRVPLLPDNYAPDRSPSSAHAPETPDAALPASQLSVVAAAAAPVAAVMTEAADGSAGLDVDVGRWILAGGGGSRESGAVAAQEEAMRDGGLLREVLAGMVDDHFASSSSSSSAKAKRGGAAKAAF